MASVVQPALPGTRSSRGAWLASLRALRKRLAGGIGIARPRAEASDHTPAEQREADGAVSPSAADRARSEMMAAVVHELKTPLTSMLGYVSILRKRLDRVTPEQREEFFTIIARQGERVLRLIEDLLQSSRMEAGLPALRRQPIDLQSVVRRTVSDMGGALGNHLVRLDLPDDALDLFGDPTAIEHVLSNLIDNAVKYSPAGTAISVRVRRAPSEVLVSVSDEGIGIPAEELPRIFERFHRVEGVDGGPSSVGLGLHIVRGLVHAHGGRVWADSESGRGTTFTVALPRRRGAEPFAPAAVAGMPAVDAEQAPRWAGASLDLVRLPVRHAR